MTWRLLGVLVLSGAGFAAPVPDVKEPAPATDQQRMQAQKNLKAILLGMHKSMGDAQPNVPLEPVIDFFTRTLV